jgi:outer membrane translocation and assembly module TamA
MILLGLGVVACAYAPSLTLAGAVLPSVNARAIDEELSRPPGIPSDADLEHAGATIGEITIDAQDVFDTADSNDDTMLFRFVNRMHVSTRPDTIQSQLLFASGSPYSSHTLAESERILRASRYLYDAHIRPVGYHDGVVDVEVHSRDVWTLTPGFAFGRSGGKNTAGFELEELNLFGRGTELSVGATSGVDRDTKSIIYRDRQLFDSWWGLSAELSDNSDGYNRALTLEQPFYALDTRRAGGLTLLDSDRVDSLYDLGKIVGQYRTQQKLATAYTGWSDGLQDGWVRRWRAGVRYDANEFSEAPDALGSVAAPPDRKLVYPVVGYELVQDAYTTTRNRDQIERTEDVCVGWRFAAELGWADPAFGSDRSALLTSASLSKGLDLTPRQSLLLSGRLSGRLEHSGLADGLASTSARYYFRQSNRRLLFVSLGVDAASRPDPDHQILLGGDSGLRGYPLRYQAGDGRVLFTAEQRWFTDWYPFRLFNVGAAAFADIGRTWGDNPSGTPSLGLLKDVGVGLRLGNARSASGNVLHIDVALPLDGDSSIDQVQLLVQTKARF